MTVSLDPFTALFCLGAAVIFAGGFIAGKERYTAGIGIGLGGIVLELYGLQAYMEIEGASIIAALTLMCGIFLGFDFKLNKKGWAVDLIISIVLASIPLIIYLFT